MRLLNKYFELQQQIFDYFGYKENYRILPLDDATEYYWCLDQDANGHGCVYFSEEKFQDECDATYSNDIYTQRFLDKWVYRGKDYTMIVVDTHCDLNQCLQIFSNKKEIRDR